MSTNSTPQASPYSRPLGSGVPKSIPTVLTSPRCTKNSVTDPNENTQSKIESLVEVFLNTLLGFAVSFSAWPFVAAAFDLPYSVSSNLGITTCFTALSIARGYVVRRFFNEKLHRAAQALTRRSN